MPDTPIKRPWFQFHLSTAIVLMFVAGGLLWLNIIPRNDTSFGFLKILERGWPWSFYKWNSNTSDPTTHFYGGMLAADMAVSLGIVFIITMAFENLARIPAPSNRLWYHLHTTTAIVVLLAAVGLIWLNLHSGKYEYWVADSNEGRLRYGWPFPAIYAEFYCTKAPESPFIHGYAFHKHPRAQNYNPPYFYDALTANIAIALLLLLCISLIIEIPLRRLENHHA